MISKMESFKTRNEETNQARREEHDSFRIIIIRCDENSSQVSPEAGFPRKDVQNPWPAQK